MSSQDTINNAQSEEENASAVQHEIDREQADIADLQKDINSKAAVISSLQERHHQHMQDAQRLRQQAMDEQKQEQKDLMHEQQKANEKGLGDMAQDVVTHNLF